MGRPCSSQVYQVIPTPASCATSSRRKPCVRRRGPGGSPTSPGLSRARRALRKPPSAARRGWIAVSVIGPPRSAPTVRTGSDIPSWGLSQRSVRSGVLVQRVEGGRRFLVQLDPGDRDVIRQVPEVAGAGDQQGGRAV